MLLQGAPTKTCLELQHIIRTQHLFLFDAEVDSGDAGVGMVEEF